MWMTSLSASVQFVIYFPSQPTVLRQLKLAATYKTQIPFLKWDRACIYHVYSTFENMFRCHTKSQIIHKLYTQKRSNFYCLQNPGNDNYVYELILLQSSSTLQ